MPVGVDSNHFQFKLTQCINPELLTKPETACACKHAALGCCTSGSPPCELQDHETPANHKQEPLPRARRTQAFTPRDSSCFSSPDSCSQVAPSTSTTHRWDWPAQSLLAAAPPNPALQLLHKQSGQSNRARSRQGMNQTRRDQRSARHYRQHSANVRNTLAAKDSRTGDAVRLKDLQGHKRQVRRRQSSPRTESNPTAHHKKLPSGPGGQMHRKPGATS